MRMSFLALAVAMSGLPRPALAADGAAPPARGADITVVGDADRQPSATASRLGLTPRETPATVETLTQADLQFHGARTAREAFASIPGAIAGNVPGNPAVVMMRGFSGSAIAILQDGVPISTSTVVQRDTNSWHFDSIEVVKGPASVLQGAGALGGIINKVTRKPTFDGNHVDALLSYGSFDTLTTAAGINVRLSDTVALRADASRMRSDSLYDVAGNRTRSTGLTASLLFRPNSDVSVLVAVDHYNDRYNGSYQGLPLVSASVARDASTIVTTTNGMVIDRSLRRQTYNPAGSTSGADETTLRSRIDWTLGRGWSWSTDLTAYTATRNFILSDTQTFTAPSVAFPNGSFKRTLQRFYHDHQFYNARSALAHDGPVLGLRNRLSLGVEYNHTDFVSLRQSAPNTTVAAVDPWAPVPGSIPTDDGAYTSGNQLYASRLDTTSLFAEEALNLTPHWLLVGGIRYDDIRLKRTVTNALTTPATVTSANPAYHPVSWRLGTTWDVTGHLTLYGQYTTAVVPVSSMLLQTIASTGFRLTTGHAWEGGFKFSAFAGRVSATGAAYVIRQNDILTYTTTAPVQSIQGGSQSSRGVELTLAATLTRLFSVGGSMGYTDARYDQLLDSAGVDRSGNRPINVPAATLEGHASYRVPGTPVTVSGFARHVSGFYTDTANTIHVAGHTTLDASLAWAIGGKATLTLRGRNLTDAFYGEYSGYPTTNIYIGAPRSVDAALAVHF